MMNAKFCLKSTILGTWCWAESLQIVKQNKSPGPVWLPCAAHENPMLPPPLPRWGGALNCPSRSLASANRAAALAATFLRSANNFQELRQSATAFCVSLVKWPTLTLSGRSVKEAIMLTFNESMLFWPPKRRQKQPSALSQNWLRKYNTCFRKLTLWLPGWRAQWPYTTSGPSYQFHPISQKVLAFCHDITGRRYIWKQYFEVWVLVRG